MRLNKENNINIIYRVVISTLIVLTILEIFVYPDMSNLFGCITFILGWILLYNIVLRTNKIKCFLPYFSMLGLGLSFFWLPLIITFIEGKPLTFRFENPYLTFFNQFLNLIMLICSYRFCFSIYRQDNIIHNLWERIGYFRAPSDKQVWALSIIGFLSYVYILTIQGTDQAESENLGIAGHFLQVLKGFASFPVILLFKNIYGGKGRYTNYLFLSIYLVIFIVLGIATGKRGEILMPFAALFMCYILPSILYNKKIFSSRNTIIIIVLVYLATGPVADLAMAMALGRDNQGHTSSVNTFDNITQLYNDKEITVVLQLKTGKVLVCSENNLCLFDLDSKQKLTSIEVKSGIWCIRELADGSVAIGEGNGNIAILEVGNDIKIKCELKGHKKAINSIIQLDNQKLVTCGDENNMILWDLKDPEAKYFIEGHTNKVSGLAHLGGNKFVSVSQDKTLKVWE